jgi:tetratricopeptide (TPR) repeat protein
LAYNISGYIYLALGRHAEALADYGAALRIDPNFPDAYLNKGVLHTRRDEWDEALHAFEAAARLGDATGAQYAARVRRDRGRQAFQAFREADTLDALRRALNSHPILARPDLLAAIEQAITAQVPPPQQPALKQRLDGLRRIIAERGTP